MNIKSVLLHTALLGSLMVMVGGCHQSEVADSEKQTVAKEQTVKATTAPSTSSVPVLEGFVKTDNYQLLAYQNRIEIHSGAGAPLVFEQLNRKAFAKGVEYTSNEPGLEAFEVTFRDEACQDTNMVVSVVIDDETSMQGCARVKP